MCRDTLGGQKIVLDPLELQAVVSHPMWVLRSKLSGSLKEQEAGFIFHTHEHTCACTHTHCSQSTSRRSWFSPSTICIPGIEVGSQAWWFYPLSHLSCPTLFWGFVFVRLDFGNFFKDKFYKFSREAPGLAVLPCPSLFLTYFSLIRFTSWDGVSCNPDCPKTCYILNLTMTLDFRSYCSDFTGVHHHRSEFHLYQARALPAELHPQPPSPIPLKEKCT